MERMFTVIKNYIYEWRGTGKYLLNYSEDEPHLEKNANYIWGFFLKIFYSLSLSFKRTNTL